MKHKYIIVGLGVTGQALIEYLSAKGESCIGFEELSQDNYLSAQNKFKGKNIEFIFGKLPAKIFDNCKQVLVSPGVPLTRSWVQEAKKREIPIVGELEFASQLIDGPILAVTGTNGKSTTVSLLQSILKMGGMRTSLKGNIGQPLITAVEEPPQDYYVVEVSSYQLETIEKFHPKISVMLNVSADHLDRYENLDEYAAAKKRIFMNQTTNDYFIYSADDPRCVEMAHQSPAVSVPFSLVNQMSEGGFIDNKDMVFCFKGKVERYPLSLSTLIGLHNQENMLAAVIASRLAGVGEEAIRKGLGEFKGLHHRLEFVGTYRGISFYDDSKGTNVGSVVMSLASFDERVILILGGRDKGGDYSPLKSLIKSKVTKLIVLGEAQEKICRSFEGIVEIIRVQTIKDAVQKSYELGESGDSVLLSPACSSFDQYKNYVERGKDFQKWVKKIANQ